MTEIDISKISNAIKGKTIEKVIQYGDCIGQTFLITCTDNTEIEINRNNDDEFFMHIFTRDHVVDIWSRRDW